MATCPCTLLWRIAYEEGRFISTPEIFRPYSVLRMEWIAICQHIWAVFTLREGPEVNTEIPIPRDIVSEEDFNICARLLTALPM